MADSEVTHRTAAQWGPDRLGAHPAPGSDEIADLPLTEYLPRPHGQTVRQLLARTATRNDASFILMVGSSASGETRALSEAVTGVLPDWPLLRPADAEELSAWVEASLVGPHTVLWLDEAQRYLDGAPGERAAKALGRLLDQVAPLAVVGTIWPDHLRRLTESCVDGRDEAPHVRALLTGRHPRITVPDTLSGDSPAVAAAAARDPRVAPEKLGLVLRGVDVHHHQ